MRGTLRERFDAKVRRSESGCWLWTGSINPTSGYGMIAVTTGHPTTAHRVAWFLEHGEWPAGGLCVCHHCDVRPCVRPDHLFVGTHRDNAQDAIAKGRIDHAAIGSLAVTPRGEAHYRTRLTLEQVEVIRRRRAAGERGAALAREFGIAPQTICNITKGRAWKHAALTGGPQ